MAAPILLTGATGYIGDRLLRRFEDGGRVLALAFAQRHRLVRAAMAGA